VWTSLAWSPHRGGRSPRCVRIRSIPAAVRVAVRTLQSRLDDGGVSQIGSGGRLPAVRQEFTDAACRRRWNIGSAALCVTPFGYG
jgi:hypothetical protein